MNAFTRFCLVAHRPAVLGPIVLTTLDLVGSTATKAWLHQWRWQIIWLMAAALVIQIVVLVAQKNQKRLASEAQQTPTLNAAERLPH